MLSSLNPVPTSSFYLTCVWLRNPASGRLECFWQRTKAGVERREILANLAMAA